MIEVLTYMDENGHFNARLKDVGLLGVDDVSIDNSSAFGETEEEAVETMLTMFSDFRDKINAFGCRVKAGDITPMRVTKEKWYGDDE